MRSAKDIERAMTAHADAVWRACALHCASQADVQDAFQETFIKYAQADGTMFADDEHRKAWLLRVAINQCKDMLRDSRTGLIRRRGAARVRAVRGG